MEEGGRANFRAMAQEPDPATPSATRGRPVATSHTAIERAAFALFAAEGFERTTMDAIAGEVGVSKRTLFRYYSSKNDIPWGQFAWTLANFRKALDDMPLDIPVHEAVHLGVLQFNTFPEDATPSHRDRMRLILTTPELQAHSVHQYAAWRAVIEEFVTLRLACEPGDLTPRLAGHVSLALALSAYEIWLENPSADLVDVLDEGMTDLRLYLQA